jgi:hypothetical protein
MGRIEAMGMHKYEFAVTWCKWPASATTRPYTSRIETETVTVQATTRVAAWRKVVGAALNGAPANWDMVRVEMVL